LGVQIDPEKYFNILHSRNRHAKNLAKMPLIAEHYFRERVEERKRSKHNLEGKGRIVKL